MKILAKTVGLTALLGGIVFAVDVVAGPFFSLAAQGWGPEQRGDKMIGVVEGHLKGADAATHTLRVASGFLGLRSFPLQVTTNTLIGVHGKLGGFGDLDRGQLVRAVYEAAADRFVASRVDVLSTGATTPVPTTPLADLSEDTRPDLPARRAGVVGSGAIESAVAAPVVVPVAPAAPTPTAPAVPVRLEPRRTDADGDRLGDAATPAPRATVEGRRPPQPRTAPTPSAAPRAAVESPRAPRPRRTPTASPAPRPATQASRPSVSGSSPASASANAAPARREAEDAGAVIDWLLNSSPARDQ